MLAVHRRLEYRLISSLLVDALETVEHKHEVRCEHLHQTRLLRRPLEHELEAHLLFVDLPILDLVPAELDHLVLVGGRERERWKLGI